MKKVAVVIVLIFLETVSFAQNLNCSDFKKGTFVNIRENVQKETIKRTSKYQYEKIEDKRIKLRIAWLDECTYKLVFVKANKAWWTSHGNNPTYNVIVKIIEIKDNTCFQEAKFENIDDFVYKSTILKIK